MKTSCTSHLCLYFQFCRMASSGKCHQGPCTHPEKFNKEQYTFLCEVEKTTIKYMCVCYTCSKHLKGNVNNPKFKPQWHTKPYKRQTKCSIQN